jgi:hypothetical protein
MRSKLSMALAAAGCALVFSVGAAKADTIQTFDLLSGVTFRPTRRNTFWNAHH